MQMQQADLHLWCLQSINMARLYLLFIASRLGQKGHMLPPPPPLAFQNNEWFFFCPVDWLCVCVCGGGGDENLAPFTPTPPNPYIFVWVWWLKGQAGYPGFCMASTGNYQTIQNYFCSLEITWIRLKVLFVCFGVLRPSQHYLGYFWAGQFT